MTPLQIKIILENQVLIMKALSYIPNVPNQTIDELHRQVVYTKNEIKQLKDNESVQEKLLK